MLTIREIKERTETFLKTKGVANPRLDTDTLIAHSLEIRRLDLYLDLDRPLTEAQLAHLRPLVRRRAAREPLQYILGTVEFCGLELNVDRRALIPRFETEELFEMLCAAFPQSPERILDLGTGTGALALALANHFTQAEITAVDISGEALSLARENAEKLGLTPRIRFLEGSWFEPLDATERFDLIVANPPYLTEEEMTTAEPEVIQYEPGNALVAGVDGLDDIRRILARAAHFLEPDGMIALETGIAQKAELDQIVADAGLGGQSKEDLSERPRFYFAGHVGSITGPLQRLEARAK